MARIPRRPPIAPRMQGRPPPPWTVGQRFEDWEWDGEKWVVVGEVEPASVVTSPGATAPSNPAPGQLWFDSGAGALKTWWDGAWR